MEDNEHSSEIHSFITEMARRYLGGDMPLDDIVEAIKGMAASESHEITDMFRTALYVLGREDMAAYVQHIGIRFLGTAGIGIGFSVDKDLETPELEAEINSHGKTLQQAIVAVMAAGNMRAVFEDDGSITIVGWVREPEGVAKVVAEFNHQFEREFGPVVEQPRGEGWQRWT